jgi:hypothetical protein
MSCEYFGSVVLFTALGKYEFLLTDSDMLAYSKFGWCTTYGILFTSHLRHIFSISISVTFEDAMPVVL